MNTNTTQTLWKWFTATIFFVALSTFSLLKGSEDEAWIEIFSFFGPAMKINLWSMGGCIALAIFIFCILRTIRCIKDIDQKPYSKQ